MANLIHIVGPQGSGKTLLAQALAAGLQQQGQSIRILESDEALYFTNAKARALQVNSVIVEADRKGARHADLAPQDYLLTLTRGPL